MRINKFLALAGVGSRRHCDRLIEDGLVIVNGKVAHYGLNIGESDEVLVNHQKVSLHYKEYYLFHKPFNVLSTLSDPFKRKTIADFIKHIDARIFPVGRLDYDSYGLMLLTNDGDLAHRIQHPKYGIKKVYHVKVNAKMSINEIKEFESGVVLDEGKTAVCTLKELKPCYYEVTLHQGWKRQIRRMFAVFDKEVLDLKRVSIGSLALNDLKEGYLRKLTEKEIKELKKI